MRKGVGLRGGGDGQDLPEDAGGLGVVRKPGLDVRFAHGNSQYVLSVGWRMWGEGERCRSGTAHG